MKNSIKKSCFALCSLLVLGLASLKAQVSFQISSSELSAVTAASYIQGYNTVVFFDQTKFTYYNLQEPAAAEWYDLEGADQTSAALAWGPDNLLIFEGSSYRNFQVSTLSFVSEWQTWPGMPAAWRNKLDGAVQWSENTIMFFQGINYSLYDSDQNTFVQEGKITEWGGWPSEWTALNATVNVGDGNIYFFNNGAYIYYNLAQQTFSSIQGQSNQPDLAATSRTTAFTSNNNQSTNTSNVKTTTKIESPFIKTLLGERKRSALVGSDMKSENGRLIYDQLSMNLRVKEINVFFSEVDGNRVISGIQTIAADARGFARPQRILGKKTADKEVVELSDQEVVTNISVFLSEKKGSYLEAIQINTNLQENQILGTPNSPALIYNFEPGQYLGIQVGFKSHVTGFGVVHSGSMDLPRLKQTSTVSSKLINQSNTAKPVSTRNSNSEEVAASTSTIEIKDIAGEYSDKYDDYVETKLGDLNDYSNVQPLPGLDWLGAGFDILYYDPIRPNSAKYRKNAQSIIVSTSGKRAGNKNQYLKPFGSYFTSLNDGEQIDTSAMISSYEDYSNQFNIGVKGSVEVPKLAKASKSLSFSQMNKSNLGSEKIFMMNTSKRKIHSVSMRLFWEDLKLGKLRQKLNPEFRREILALKVVDGDFSKIHIKKKNVSLPSKVKSVAAEYEKIMKKYGTHFSEKVVWGGQYVTRMELLKSNFEKSNKTAVEYQQSAEVQIKKVKVGSEQSVGNTNESTQGSKDMNNRTIKYIIGGNGEDDLNLWRSKVDDNPAPVDIEFMAISDLLITQLFPEDPDIQQKSEILRMVTEKYIQDNYEIAQKSKGGFWKRATPIAETGSITVHNNGAYVMWVNVQYFTKEGEVVKKETGSFPAGQVKQIPLPLGCHTIIVKAAQTGGDIFTEVLPQPVKKCYKCVGTVFKGWKEACTD